MMKDNGKPANVMALALMFAAVPLKK
jgi:hypothetical protein